MFFGTWWSLVPPVLAIVLALITKEVYLSLFCGVFLGALFTANFAPWNTFDTLFTTMTGSINLNIIIFDVLLGMIIMLMSKCGGTAAYGAWAAKRLKTKKSSLFATVGLGILIFVDDYFNCLTVGSVMRPVTDKNKVSRAKLAYIIDATAAPVCIIAPISSWAAAVNSYVPEDSTLTGFQLFLSTIPFNLYALLTIFMVLFIIATNTDFGLMKKHEQNAAKGDLFTSGGEEFQAMAEEEKKAAQTVKGHVIDLVLPMVVLIAAAVFGMIYTGFLGGAANVVDAFANCNAEMSLIFATIVTVVFMAVLYLPRRVITMKEFMQALPEGAKLMVPAILILTFAWTLKGMGDNLGIAAFIGESVSLSGGVAAVVPAVMFCIAVFLAFSTGTSWGTFAILVPIVINMFNLVDEKMMVIAVASVLAGAVCGDHISPISDTTIMSSAGAQCNHINHVQTQMQYAVIVAVVCVFGYLIAGFTKSWFAALLICLAILTFVLMMIRKYSDGHSSEKVLFARKK